jgi:UDP-glucose 4-epimerase
MNILITGVGGFIASHIANRFISEGFSVVGVDDFSSGRRENVPPGVDLIVGDLADQDIIQKLPKSCILILHLAGQSSGEMSFDNPILDLNKNSISTLNLIKYGIEVGVKKMLFASSVSIYGFVGDRPLVENDVSDPSSCYGVSKLAAEGYLRIYSKQLAYVNMRMFNVYGPGQDMKNLRQGMISIYLAQALSGGNIHVKGSLNRFRDYIYIDDVVEAWFRASTFEGVKNIAINVGTGVRTTVNELLHIIKDELPKTSWYVEGGTLGDQFGHYSNNHLLGEVLGINKFTKLADGVRKFVVWGKKLSI